VPDFHLDLVPTFTLLPDEGFEAMERRILRSSARVPIGVVIPALYSDLISAAMGNIIEQLAGMDFIKRVYISLDQANLNEFRKAAGVITPLGSKGVLLWNDSPKLQKVIEQVETQFNLGPRGKGRAVWTALGYILAKGEVSVLAFHDADILTYNRRFLIRLLYLVVQKRYQFAKGFYVRYADRLYGRVARLFYFPFVRALREILGPCEFLDFMSDFRYPLSGEFATFTSLAREMQFPSDWGVEVGMLGEVYRLVRIPRICQVELTDRYDHKHQGLGPGGTGLARMAADIARTFFTHLSSQGIVLKQEVFNTLRLTYLIHAREGVNVYEAFTEMHDHLAFDLHSELSTVETFAAAIEEAVADFYRHPFGSPVIPDWRRIEVAFEGITTRLMEALENPVSEVGVP
jgi:glucosyl-3-phosphoglycerate synthase